MKSPHVSIIIINYNGYEHTKECLSSLIKIDYSNYKVFLVDNNSKNNEGYRLASEFKSFITLIQNKDNYGFCKGNNIAIKKIFKEGISKYILLLNNDTIVDPDFLNMLVEKAETARGIGSVSPKIMQYYDKSKIDSLGIIYYKCGMGFSKNFIDNTPIFSATGTCVLYPVKVLKDIAYKGEVFDENFFMYSEDLDVGFRILHKGYFPIYEERSIVYHKGSATSGAASDFSRFYLQKNNTLVIYKNYPISLLILYFFPILLMHLAIYILYIKRKKLSVLLRADLNAIKSFKSEANKRRFIMENSHIHFNKLLSYFPKSSMPFKFIYFFNLN